MKKHLFYFLVLISTFTGACKSEKKSTPDNKIVIGTIDSLYSKILNEERKVWVYVPAMDKLFSPQKFPVVYLLDGDAHFYSVMGMIQQLSEVNMNMVLPRMILVAIENTNRTRDLTPSKDTLEDRNSGGGENFTLFIEKELIPYIDSLYPTSPYRTLVGHSYGGLFSVNTLLNHTNLFNGYIAIDPTIRWDSNKILKQAEELLTRKNFEGTSFFLSIANQGYSDTETSKDNAAAFELAKCLDANKKNNLIYSWHYYQDDNHGSVPLISEYDGLRFLFNFYNPRISYTKFRNPAYNVDSFVVAHFNSVSSRMGYKVSPPESFMNWLGYLFIMEKQYDKAYRLLKINIDNYPASANVYDTMGELLLLKGDTVASIESYEKSLKFNPGNENARNIIKKLKK
jgi:predicted alpha/beta superfamily hydrolase